MVTIIIFEVYFLFIINVHKLVTVDSSITMEGDIMTQRKVRGEKMTMFWCGHQIVKFGVFSLLIIYLRSLIWGSVD